MPITTQGGTGRKDNTMNDAPGTAATDGIGAPPSSGPARSVQRRAALLAALVGACALAYGLMLARFDLLDRPVEIELGQALGGRGIALYLQPIQVDPVNASMLMRISMAPGTVQGEAAAAVADRNLLLRIRRSRQVEQVTVGAGQPLPEVVFDFNLKDGDVRDYPLDRYGATMALAVSERGADGAETPLPIHVTVWEGLLGFSVSGQPAPAQGPEAVGLSLEIRRTRAVSIFGIAIYGAMVVMAGCALLIGSLVFVGIRRIEVTFAGALGAIIFALPALRAALPGAPPLGVRGDVLFFFWAEFGALVALCLFVAAWARRGAQP
jgi:hypothetical protein